MTEQDRENTREALRFAPELIEHVVSLVPVKSRPGADDDVRVRRAVPPLPMNEGAFSDANELYGRLVHWAVYWGGVLGVQAPGPARRSWRSGVSVVGLPAGVTPSAARYDVGIMASWLAVHLDEIFRRPADDVAYFVAEVAEWHRVAARYPVSAQPRWTGMSCRVAGCDGRVALYPFTEVKKWSQDGEHVFLPPEGARVLCAVCSDQWSQVEYEVEVQRRVLAAKEQQKSDRVRARLAKKYAEPSSYPLFFGTVGGKVRHPVND